MQDTRTETLSRATCSLGFTSHDRIPTCSGSNQDWPLAIATLNRRERIGSTRRCRHIITRFRQLSPEQSLYQVNTSSRYQQKHWAIARWFH